MNSSVELQIGQWYIDYIGAFFKIVAIDELHHNVEIQYFDGSISEIEFSTWLDNHPIPINYIAQVNDSYELELEDRLFAMDDNTFTPIHPIQKIA